MIDAGRLALLRVSRGLSQRKLAHLVGVNFQVIRRIEAGGDDGNLTLRHLSRLCDTLAVQPIELLSASTATESPADQDHDAGELTVAQARLLRSIDRGEDVRRVLTVQDRELLIPSLVHRGSIKLARAGRIVLSDAAKADLEP